MMIFVYYTATENKYSTTIVSSKSHYQAKCLENIQQGRYIVCSSPAWGDYITDLKTGSTEI
jgi:hypothetical protein